MSKKSKQLIKQKMERWTPQHVSGFRRERAGASDWVFVTGYYYAGLGVVRINAGENVKTGKGNVSLRMRVGEFEYGVSWFDRDIPIVVSDAQLRAYAREFANEVWNRWAADKVEQRRSGEVHA